MPTFEDLVGGALLSAFGSHELAAAVVAIIWIITLAVLRIPAEVSLPSAGLLFVIVASPIAGGWLSASVMGIVVLIGAVLLAFAVIKIIGGRW